MPLITASHSPSRAASHAALQILNNGRFGLGAATGGGIRKLISLAAEYANNRIQFGRPIASFGLIQEKFARMASDAYAIEAMAYTTTALIDGPALDMSVEAAIVKVYGSECMFSAINECIQILGGVGFAAGGAYPFERLLRDAVRAGSVRGRGDACWVHRWRSRGCPDGMLACDVGKSCAAAAANPRRAARPCVVLPLQRILLIFEGTNGELACTEGCDARASPTPAPLAPQAPLLRHQPGFGCITPPCPPFFTCV